MSESQVSFAKACLCDDFFGAAVGLRVGLKEGAHQLPDADSGGSGRHPVVRDLCEHVGYLMLQWPKGLRGRRVKRTPFVNISSILNLKNALTQQCSFNKKRLQPFKIKTHTIW